MPYSYGNPREQVSSTHEETKEFQDGVQKFEIEPRDQV